MRVDVLASTSVEANKDDRPHSDPGLKVDNGGPTGFGHGAGISGSHESAKARAVSADSSNATRGEP